MEDEQVTFEHLDFCRKVEKMHEQTDGSFYGTLKSNLTFFILIE